MNNICNPPTGTEQLFLPPHNLDGPFFRLFCKNRLTFYKRQQLPIGQVKRLKVIYKLREHARHRCFHLAVERIIGPIAVIRPA